MEAEQILQPQYLVFFVSLSLVLSVPVRFVLIKYNSGLPQHLLMGILGVFLGLIMIFVKGNRFVGLSEIPADCMLSVFLPIYITQVLYRIDFNIFKRCLPQTLVIVLIGVFSKLIIVGAIIKFILQSEWSYSLSCLAALAYIPLQPSHVALMFKELARYSYLGTFLEAESVLTCVPVFIVFDILLSISNGKVILWYELIMISLWSVFGGLVVGYICGRITAALVCWIYNEPQGTLCVLIGATFFTYFLCHYIVRVSGSLALIALVYLVVHEKHRLSAEVDICLDSFWQTLYYMSENISIVILFCEMVKYIWLYAEPRDIYDIVLVYFCNNIVRLIFFQAIGFVINRMAYNINVRCLLVLGWSGIKGSINIICAMLVFNAAEAKYHVTNLPIEMAAFVFLTALINNTSMRITLRLTGLSELSSTRRSNMNNCMKFIIEKRFSVINMLRLNRYLSDANWALVRSETIMQHPYKIKITDIGPSDDEDEETLWNASSAICPECFKEVPFDISDKELVEMMKEAQIKILKAKKVSIIKQYETGIINRNSLEILIHYFEIMIASNQKDNVVDLSAYLKENNFLVLLTKILIIMDTRERTEPPQIGQIHKLCFYLMMHTAYDYVLFALSVIYCVGSMYYLISFGAFSRYVFFLITLNIVFVLDFIIKLQGYGNTYSMQAWNVFDFIMLILGLMDLLVTIVRPFANVIVIKSLCILRFIKIFYILQPAYPKFIKAIESRYDSSSSAGYDLATALMNCCDEILDLLLQIIEVNKIRDIYTRKIQHEKQDLVKMMDHIQKIRPWIAITMKTKQIIRIGLTSMEEALNQLKFSGFVDNIEYSFIYKEIYAKQKFLRNLKYVHPSPPKLIFNEVPWMAHDTVTLEFLYNHVKTTRWDVGDVICKDGKKPPGVIIVVTGLLNLKYHPKESTIDRMNKIGHIPIVDYLSMKTVVNVFEETITSGNTLGELSLLTGRNYDCDVIAFTPGQAYILTFDILRDAMKLKHDPIGGLEARLWKHATYNMALAVLLESPLYQTFTHEQIKMKLERGFLPNLRCYKMFIVTEMMEDVMLVEGVVADYNTGTLFTAPVLIPKDIQKIVFPRTSLFEMDYQDTVLLIIPVIDVADRDVIEEEEMIAELVSLPSSTCLLHSVQASQRKTKRRRSRKKAILSSMHGADFDIEANLKETLKRNISTTFKKEAAKRKDKERQD